MSHLCSVPLFARDKLHLFIQQLPTTANSELTTQIAAVLEGAARWMFVSLPTGFGKTLYLSSQCLLDNSLGETWITEPTVTSAVSIYRTLATTLGQRDGSAAWVGYGAGGEAWYTPRTRLKVMTTGHAITLLLRLIARQGAASKPFHIILDEMHHPTTENYVALMLVKHLTLTLDVDVHVTVSSATLDQTRLDIASFPNAVLVEQVDSERKHPIEELFVATDDVPYHDAVRLCFTTTLEALGRHPESSGIVFLAGEDCVHTMAAKLESATADDVEVLTVYSNMPTEVLDQITSLCAKDKRRVYVCTNVAETGITLPDADWVVDSGYCKTLAASTTPGAQALILRRTSRANAKQRAGRVGRCRPGFAYRAYGADVVMEEHMPSEFEVVPPYGACLKLIGAGVDIAVLGMPLERQAKTLDQLVELGVLLNATTITKLGRRVSSVPVSVKVAAALLAAADTETMRASELLAISVFLAVVESAKFGRLFYVPQGCRSGPEYKAFYEDKCSPWVATDDFEAVVRIVLEAQEHRKNLKGWCREHSFNDLTIKTILGIANTLLYHAFYCEWAQLSDIYNANAEAIDFDLARHWLVARFADQIMAPYNGKYVSQARKLWVLDSKRMLYRGQPGSVLPMNLFEHKASSKRDVALASCIVQCPVMPAGTD